MIIYKKVKEKLSLNTLFIIIINFSHFRESFSSCEQKPVKHLALDTVHYTGSVISLYVKLPVYRK